MRSKMNVPDPNTGVLDLEYDLLQNLQMMLGRNEAWKLVADATGLFSEPEILKMSVNSSPTYELLTELNNKLCTVAVLCHILDRCQLYDALALLKEPELAAIIVHPGNGSDCIYIQLGSELQLECQATGLPPPQYMWYNGNEEIPRQMSTRLSIPKFNIENEGDYYCCVTQPSIAEQSEIYSETVSVKILPECPRIVEQPARSSDCQEGDDVTLTCLAEGYPLPEYQWFHENTQLTGRCSSELIIKNIGLCNNGTYKCYVHSKGGDVWSGMALIDVRKKMCRSIVTEKVALLIANDTYQQLGPLVNPTNDVALLASKLSKLGFKVIALRNLTRIEMKNATQMFCKLLPEGAYGFFYFAGHGFEMQDKFMLPVNAPGTDSFLRSDSLCEKEVIRDVLVTKPQLFVILLDMCLKIPDVEENPGIHSEVPEVFSFQPERNLIQGYATTSNLGAYERKTESNGIYVKYLKELIMKDLPINNILQRVGKHVAALETNDVSAHQMPSLTENVVADFYFNDEVIGDEEIDASFKQLNHLPQDTRIWFKNLKVHAFAKFHPYRYCFHNALEIWITGLDGWKVMCEIGFQGVELTLERKESMGNYLIVTIHKLQRVRIPLMLTLSLIDPASAKLVDNGILDLDMPLIAPADLWFHQQNEHSV